jgi:tetratricopeptide (TPR) repeat protein
MAVAQAPNGALAAAIVEARMSNKGLAKRVRDLAQQDGRPISTDHVAISRYLDGMQPKPRTAEYIARSISERVGRRVAPGDLGLALANDSTSAVLPSIRYSETAAGAAENLARLARVDVQDRSLPELSRWDHQATSGVITGYLFDSPGAADVDPSDAPPLDAAAIRITTANLMDLDFQLGGGHTRGMLLYFFQNQVLPLFRAKPPPGTARRELLAATAELTQMLGWSAYDAGRHGAAQRYFVHGLRLAREAEDASLGARLLSNLSHQANYLGRLAEAAHLARAAQSAAGPASSATVSAMLLTMEARALASLGDARGCTAVLARAEREFERHNSDDDPPWIGYFTHAELAGESAHCFRDLGRSEETDHFCRLAIEPRETPARTVAFINMVSAMGALNSGDLDQALAVAQRSIELAGPLQSRRYQRYLTDFVSAVAQRHPREASGTAFARLVAQRFPADVAS